MFIYVLWNTYEAVVQFYKSKYQLYEGHASSAVNHLKSDAIDTSLASVLNVQGSASQISNIKDATFR